MNHLFLKITTYLMLGFTIITVINCGQSSGNGAKNLLFLNIQPNQGFNPNADHGKIEKYKLTITGSELSDPIEKFYSKDTEGAAIDGLPTGSDIQVQVDAININNLCVRRGQSKNITIQGGQNTMAELAINNVPIFANVSDGAIVYNNRFSPKVFAPGEIDFQISDGIQGSFSLIEDTVSLKTNFSISKDSEQSILKVNAPTFSIGQHELMVKDPESGELSQISVTVLDGTIQKALPTTAGAHLGTVIMKQSNLITTQWSVGSYVEF